MLGVWKFWLGGAWGWNGAGKWIFRALGGITCHHSFEAFREVDGSERFPDIKCMSLA